MSERNSKAALWLKYRCPDGIIKIFQFLVQQTGKSCDVNIVIRDGNKEEHGAEQKHARSLIHSVVGVLF